MTDHAGPSDLAGAHVALATPISPGGGLDLDGLDRLVDRVVAGGVDGICPTGSTGEGPRLTRSERLAVLRAVRDRVGTDRLVVPAASAMTVDDAVAEIAGFAEAGANAVLLAPPCYYPMPAADQAAWFSAVAGRAELPIVLYNIPSMTTVSLDPGAVGHLAGLPGVIGIKDSSRDMEYLQHVVAATRSADFAVVTGTDTLLQASLMVGAVGMIAASANLVPSLGRAIVDAVGAGDAEAARTAQARLVPITDACRTGTPPAGWKAALTWAGVCGPDLVAPAAGLDAEQRAALGAVLDRLDVP